MKKGRILLLCLAAALALAGWLVWSARAPGAADAWMAEQRARGEKFTLAELGLDRVGPTTNLLAELVESSSGPLKQLAAGGVRTSRVPPKPARGQDLVKIRLPTLASATGVELDWTNATAVLDSLRPVFERLEAGLQEPPAASGVVYTNYFTSLRTISFVAIRSAGQGLYDAELLELHRGNLPAALDHQLALLRVARAYSKDGILLSQMIRTAVAAMGLDGVWQALQSPGWTEPQLASLQEELELLSLFPEFRRSLEVERAMVHELMVQVQDRGPDVLRGALGAGSPADDFWGRRMLGLWRSLWSDGDRLMFLRSQQEYLGGLRAIEAGQPAPIGLRACELATQRLEQRMRSLFAQRYWFSRMAIPAYGKATERVLGIDLLRRLSLLAVACERFRLREGHYPSSLADLEPALLRAPVLDPFSGQPFCYRLQEDRFLLYSVGRNGRDDGGNAALAPPTAPASSFGGGLRVVWEGLDAVWPAPAPDPVPVDETTNKQ